MTRAISAVCVIIIVIGAVLLLAACTAAQEARFDARVAQAARYCQRIEVVAPLAKPALVLHGVPAAEVAKGEAAIAAYCQAIKAVAVPAAK
jgi:hypothetical protein